MRVKPVLTFRDGEIVRASLVRSREAGMRRLLKLIGGMGSLRDVIVSHSTNRDELERFLLHLKDVYP